MYVVRVSNDEELYKIGKTKDLSRRLKTFRTSNPYIELVKAFDCDSLGVSMSRLENALHQELRMLRLRTRKEIFQIDGARLSWLITLDETCDIPLLSLSPYCKKSTARL